MSLVEVKAFQFECDRCFKTTDPMFRRLQPSLSERPTNWSIRDRSGGHPAVPESNYRLYCEECARAIEEQNAS